MILAPHRFFPRAIRKNFYAELLRTRRVSMSDKLEIVLL
jgi:hypothetical protein